MITYEYTRRLTGTGVTANAIHLGFISTNLGQDFNWFIRGLMRVFSKSPKKGAETSIYAASSPDLDGTTGKYFANKKETPSSEASYDEAVARRLWDISIELTHLNRT